MKRILLLIAISLMVACQQRGWQPPNARRLVVVTDSVQYTMWLDTASIDSAGKAEGIPFFPESPHEFIKYTVYIAHRDSVGIDSPQGALTEKPIDGAVEIELAHCRNLEYYTHIRTGLYHGRVVAVDTSYDSPLDFRDGYTGDRGPGVCERCNRGIVGGTMVQTACAYAAHKHLVTVSK